MNFDDSREFSNKMGLHYDCYDIVRAMSQWQNSPLKDEIARLINDWQIMYSTLVQDTDTALDLNKQKLVEWSQSNGTYIFCNVSSFVADDGNLPAL